MIRKGYLPVTHYPLTVGPGVPWWVGAWVWVRCALVVWCLAPGPGPSRPGLDPPPLSTGMGLALLSNHPLLFPAQTPFQLYSHSNI